MEHLYWDLGSYGAGARFEVELRGSTARVCLAHVNPYGRFRSDMETRLDLTAA